MTVSAEKHFIATCTDKVIFGVSYMDQQEQLQISSEVPTPNRAKNEEAECLQELKRLINNNEDISDSGIEQFDQYLLAYVRGKKCNSQKAFITLQNYFQLRKIKYPKFFQSLNPSNFRNILVGERFIGLLKHADHEGRAVVVCIPSVFNSRVHNGEDIFQAITCFLLGLLQTDNAPRNGFVIVIDASGFGFQHAREVTVGRLYMFFQIFLNSYPVKYKGFHVLNNNYIFETILTLIKKLMPKKFTQQIHLHGMNNESLHKFLPKEILLERFGGLLTRDDAYNLEFEQMLLEKTEY